MKLTKDHLIEGKIYKKGTELFLEKDSKAQDKEDEAQYAKYMKDFKDGKMKDTHGNIVKDEGQAKAIAKSKSEGDDN